MQFSVTQARDLALLLEQSGLHEISLSTPGENESPLKIVVRAAPKRARRAAPSNVDPKADQSAVLEINPQQKAVIAEVRDQAREEASELLETIFAPVAVPILSTAVGLFFLAPEIESGTAVQKNQVVAFVESMKIPTEVRAPQNGVVQDVFVEANQGVEYGQALLSLVAED